MAYEKINPAAFKSKLEGGEYTKLSGARRAIGRMEDLSDETREKLNSLTNKYFGVQGADKPSTKAPKVKADKSTKAKAGGSGKGSAKKAAKTPGRRGRPPKVKEVAPVATKAKKQTEVAPKPRGRKPGAHRGPKKQHVQSDQVLQEISAAVMPSASLQEGNYRVVTLEKILITLRATRELGAPEAGVIAVATAAQRSLLQVIEQMGQFNAELGLPDEEERKKAELFRESAPKGNSGTANEHTKQLMLPTTG